MKFFLAATVALTISADALAIKKRDVPGTISFPIHVNEVATAKLVEQALRRRAGEVFETTTSRQQLLFTIELSLGTPPQLINVQLDTGSSDMVVETPSSDICGTAPPNPCTNYGACE